jgi:hypothetical protein
MKRLSRVFYILALLVPLALQACGSSTTAKGLLRAADDAYRQTADFFRRGFASQEGVESAASKAGRVARDIPIIPPNHIPPTESQAQQLWKELKKDALCATLKTVVENDRLPSDADIATFLDEQIEKQTYKLLRGRLLIEYEISSVAKDVRSISSYAQAALNGDKDAYVGLLIELGCFSPPSSP